MKQTRIQISKTGLTIGALLFCCLFIPDCLVAQDSRRVMPINLETVLKLAGANNLKIAEIKAKHNISKAKAREAQEWVYPSVNPGFLLMNTAGSVQNAKGDFLETDKNSFWAGAAITANWSIGKASYNYLSAKQNIVTAELWLQAEKNQQILNAIQVYFELGASQGELSSLIDMSQKSDDIVRQIEVHVNSGIRYKSDLLLAKARNNHVQLSVSDAREKVAVNSNELLKILNIQDDVLLVNVDSTMLPISLNDKSPESITVIFENRPEIQAHKSTIKSWSLLRKTTTAGLLFPDFNLGLNNGLFGPYFNPLTNQLSYYIGMQWNLPLGAVFSGGKRKQFDAQIEMETVLMNQAQNTVRKELQDARAMVNNATAQMGLAQEAVSYAEAALSQSIQRQNFGTALPLEVFQAQEQLLQSKVDHIKAISNYNKGQYLLYVAKGNNL
jgi:outer membrane protein TolC